MKRRDFLISAMGAAAFAAPGPRPAGDFTAYGADGKALQLSSLKGKALLVHFIFTTCPHCQVACQTISKVNEEFGSKGFAPVAVAINPMAKILVNDFSRDYKINYPVLWSERPPAMQFLGYNADENLHVPQLMFIDRKGLVRHQSLQKEDATTALPGNMRRMVEMLVKEPAPLVSKVPGKRKVS